MTFFRTTPAPSPQPTGLVARFRAAWQRHREAAALAQLDSHLLSDIGFVRLPEAARPALVA